MGKQPIIAAGLTLIGLACGAGIAHADPDTDDPGNPRNWPCGVTVGPVSGTAFGTIIGLRGGKPCPPPPPAEDH